MSLSTLLFEMRVLLLRLWRRQPKLEWVQTSSDLYAERVIGSKRYTFYVYESGGGALLSCSRKSSVASISRRRALAEAQYMVLHPELLPKRSDA